MVLVYRIWIINILYNKSNILKVNQAVWDGLKKQIEHHTEQDNNITDVTITYQVKASAERNFLKLTVKQ